MGISEIISSVAAVVSAVGGTFAAVAASRSAESAPVAQQENQWGHDKSMGV